MKNTKAGFSLVEAIISIIIIAIAAVAALSFFVYCDRLAIQADMRITAANFARETIERLYKRDYTDPDLNAVINRFDQLPGKAAFGSRLLTRYPTATRRYTIVDRNDYKLITVTVKWD